MERVDGHGRGLPFVRVDRGRGDDALPGETHGRGSVARAAVSSGAAAGGGFIPARAGALWLFEIRPAYAAAPGGVSANRGLLWGRGGNLFVKLADPSGRLERRAAHSLR